MREASSMAVREDLGEASPGRAQQSRTRLRKASPLETGLPDNVQELTPISLPVVITESLPNRDVSVAALFSKASS